jgi:excinuclease UvrABC ATPase subunit
MGSEHISDVIDINQSPIGRSSRSNPANQNRGKISQG